MKPIDIIKRKVKELDNLRLNFTYQNSGYVNPRNYSSRYLGYSVRPAVKPKYPAR